MNMPQGGIDENEDPKVAAIRELKEETEVTSAEVLAEAPSWLTYDFPPEKGMRKRSIYWVMAQKNLSLVIDRFPSSLIFMQAVDFKKPVDKEVLAVKFRILGFSCSRCCLDYTLWMHF
ncbi:hypothetical protein OIU85_006848 [Salix viminalis]|uniref:Nudix hydrolase domain-containing protein n=1 Tax=Salix viminalis TaxID=40686 RepID=A0A9Q0PMJ0_SALVM|nr:hypothetical protein OIU85_006848 [Salix viminalis]